MKNFTLGSFTLSTNKSIPTQEEIDNCLLHTTDAADDPPRVDTGDHG